jgi:hypothetical protein
MSGDPRGDRVVKLPSVREGRVALHPPGRGAPSPALARPTPPVRARAATAVR